MITGLVTLLISAQLLVMRPYLWLPAKLLQVSFSRENLETIVAWAQPWAKRAGVLVRPRLTLLVMPPFLNVIALICLGLAMLTVPLAVLPAGENIPAVAVLLFGIALTARDGLLALIGLAATGTTVGALIYFWPKIVGLFMELELSAFATNSFGQDALLLQDQFNANTVLVLPFFLTQSP
jgi:hypothetical protein